MIFVKRDESKDVEYNILLSLWDVKAAEFHKDPHLREYLSKTYKLRCCYCEAAINSVSGFQVDHFYPQKLHVGGKNYIDNPNLYVYDVRNFHISCNRCNKLKACFNGDKSSNYYSGPALSPNYYQKNSKWNLTDKEYVQNNLMYKGAVVKSNKYDAFIKQLKMNGSTDSEKEGTRRSSLYDRARYFYETQNLLNICDDMCKLDRKMAKNLFKIVSKRFDENANYSSMIIQNFGEAYCILRDKLTRQESFVEKISKICVFIKKQFGMK